MKTLILDAIIVYTKRNEAKVMLVRGLNSFEKRNQNGSVFQVNRRYANCCHHSPKSRISQVFPAIACDLSEPPYCCPRKRINRFTYAYQYEDFDISQNNRGRSNAMLGSLCSFRPVNGRIFIAVIAIQWLNSLRSVYVYISLNFVSGRAWKRCENGKGKSPNVCACDCAIDAGRHHWYIPDGGRTGLSVASYPHVFDENKDFFSFFSYENPTRFLFIQISDFVFELDSTNNCEFLIILSEHSRMKGVFLKKKIIKFSSRDCRLFCPL